jgi:hypothetical protein
MIEGSGSGSIPYLLLMEPDPGGPKTLGSGGSGFGSGYATLVTTEYLPMRALSLGDAGASLGKSRGLSRPGDPLGDRGLKNRTFFIYFRSFLIYYRLMSGVQWSMLIKFTDMHFSP